MIEAAARDVDYVRRLWTHLVGHGWVDEITLERRSARYQALVRGNRPYQHDRFRCNGLLPQGILEDEREIERWTCINMASPAAVTYVVCALFKHAAHGMS